MADRPTRRPGTSTSNFGVGRRENHDASGFYDRFGAPELSTDTTINVAPQVDQIFVHDAADMAELPDSSVALVVTSPPYFAGKAYEEELGEGHVPASYVDYLVGLTVTVDDPAGLVALVRERAGLDGS